MLQQEAHGAGSPLVSASRRPRPRSSVARSSPTPSAEKVRAGLVVAGIARESQFQVTAEDVEKGYAELAEETGKNVAKLRVEYREKAKQDILVGMILEDKILDFIESKSNIVNGNPRRPKPRPRRKSRRPKSRTRSRKPRPPTT